MHHDSAAEPFLAMLLSLIPTQVSHSIWGCSPKCDPPVPRLDVPERCSFLSLTPRSLLRSPAKRKTKKYTAQTRQTKRTHSIDMRGTHGSPTGASHAFWWLLASQVARCWQDTTGHHKTTYATQPQLLVGPMDLPESVNTSFWPKLIVHL